EHPTRGGPAPDGTTAAPCALWPHVTERGRNHAYDHSDRYLDPGSARRAADLGPQPKLGLRARRRHRTDSHHRHRAGARRPHLEYCVISAGIDLLVVIPGRPEGPGPESITTGSR